MVPPIPSSKLTLSYPVYVCDFSPSDPSILVVGGGGGAGRNGVGNKITVLNTSRSDVIEEVSETELSKDEDNITSLAVGKTTGMITSIYAGINSSPKDLESGKNEHFKTFALDGGNEKKLETKISEIGRTKLFQEKDKDAYQRILRLSRRYPESPQESPQLGAVATGLAKTPEIVIFDTSKSPPNIKGTIIPINEAEDVDIIQTGDEAFEFAYCDKRNIYVKTISKEIEAADPILVYATPDQETNPTLPSFRSLRFLTPGFLLMLTNAHSNSGVVLQVLRLDPDRTIHARIPLSKRLPSSLKKATGVAVVNLSPPLSPGEKQGNAQFVIAVAGHDCSILLFTLEYQVVGNVDQFSNLRLLKTMKSVHPNIMTSLAFSNFTPPPHPVAGETKPQYVKLASVSMVNTVVVHTLPLSPLPISLQSGQSKRPRYVLSLPSDKGFISFSLVVALVAIALGLMAMQGLLEYQGVATPYMGFSKQEISQKWADIKQGYAPRGAYVPPIEHTKVSHSVAEPVAASTIPDSNIDDITISSAESTFPLKLQQLISKIGDGSGMVIIREEQDASNHETNPVLPASIHADLYDETIHGAHGAKTWDMLSEEEKEIWKGKLKDAGHWAEGQGETILKSIMFAQLGGLVRAAVGGAIGA